MSNNKPKRKISLVRLLIVLLIFAVVIIIGARYAMDVVADLKTGTTSTWFAPYVDVTLTPVMHFEEQSEQLSDDMVLSFIVADPQDSCLPSWGAYYNLDAAARALDLDRRIVRLRERGGDVIVSFGGAINDELALVCKEEEALAAAYGSVISRYDLQIIDFDIEGAAIEDRAANSRRAKAIQRLQQNNDHLEVWLTLPVAPHGLSEAALALVTDSLEGGMKLSGVNLMTMNFAESRAPGVTMHAATLSALTETKNQLNLIYQQAGQPKSDQELWSLLGATPMIGQNDVADDVFTTRDAHSLVEFAHNQNLGRLSFWSINRDAPCSAGADTGRVSNTCSGVDQETLEFTRIFANGSTVRMPVAAKADEKQVIPAAGEEIKEDEAFVRDDPQTSPYPLWRSDKAYETEAKVVWQGRVYQAKWWTEDEQPDALVENVWETPWRYLGPVLASDRTAVRQVPALNGNWTRWAAEEVFLAGDEVEHNKQVFRAKWWTQGNIPEEHSDQPYDHPWEYLGEVNCEDESCVRDEIAATLSVDYQSLPAISIEIRHDDKVEGMAGKLVQEHDHQSGQKTYELLQGSYDLVYKNGPVELIIDSVNCSQEMCDTVDIASTLSVDYEGLDNIRIEIRTDDGIDGKAGDLVQQYDGQSGQRSYSVLHGVYDLVFRTGTSELVVDAVDCGIDGCDVSDIGSILTVDFAGLTDVDIEVRGSDGLDGTAGTLVQAHDKQRGNRSYYVLHGSYDLVFEKGAAELIIDGFDCSGSSCNAGDIVAELTISYRQPDVSIEIRTDDGQVGTSGGVVEMFKDQNGKQLYRVLRGSYDIVAKINDSEKVHDALDCSGESCALSIPFRPFSPDS